VANGGFFSVQAAFVLGIRRRNGSGQWKSSLHLMPRAFAENDSVKRGFGRLSFPFRHRISGGVHGVAPPYPRLGRQRQSPYFTEHERMGCTSEKSSLHFKWEIVRQSAGCFWALVKPKYSRLK